jgi:CRP-like cAMP-binding protein
MARLPLVSPLDRALFLKAQPYLAGLQPSSIAALAQHTEECLFTRKQMIYEAGVAPAHIYFLQSGSVRTQYEGSPAIDLSSPRGIGFVEHMASSDVPPSVWALEETQAISVDIASFMRIVEDDFSLYMTLIRNLGIALNEALVGQGASTVPEIGFGEDRLQQTYATLDVVHLLAMARDAPFFEGSNLTVLTELLRYQEPRVLAEGSTLWTEGSLVESMTLILDGEFVTTLSGVDRVHPAGSMLSGWDVFTGEPRLDSVRAATAARIVEIIGHDFADVLEDHFEFSMDYMRKLCRRVIEIRLAGARL